MHKIRTANTVVMLKRRLDQAEHGNAEPMELIGIEDELSRVERKWNEQFAAGSERRKPQDRQTMDEYFLRLTRLIERALREKLEPPEAEALRAAQSKIAARVKA